MPDIHQTLRSTDLDFLQRIASAWGIELTARSFSAALKELEPRLKENPLLEDLLSIIPAEVRSGWDYLLAHHGHETWAIFTRQFGELRPFGAGKRSRENPDLKPASIVEALWYRGLIGRAFLNIASEPQEFAYIPDEFLAFYQRPPTTPASLQPRPATEVETHNQSLANDYILDAATEILAALRMQRPLEKANLPKQTQQITFLTSLLSQTGLLTADRLPDTTRLKDFLAAERSAALLLLYHTWLSSERLNDLRMLPGLVFEGNWTNDPCAPRNLLVGVLQGLDQSTWWSLSSLIGQVEENQPDFQRPAGDYDSWFIRDARSNEHLHGAAHWQKIEGALLRYLIAGPLHWLGVVDIARGEKAGPALSFRISPFGVDLLQGQMPAACPAEDGVITLSADDIIYVPANAPRTLRYQIARFSAPMQQTADEAKYRITPASLRLAAEQGLRANHLVQLLQQAKIKNIPPAFIQQMERWEKYGPESIVEAVTILRLARPEILPLLQKNPRAARCLGELLNPQTVIVKPGKIEPLRQALAELGFLTDITFDTDV